MPQTAAPSPGAFQAVFSEAADAGMDGVICINLSSKVSATFQAARTAADSVVGPHTRRGGGLPHSHDGTRPARHRGSRSRSIFGAASTRSWPAVDDAASRARVFGVVDSLDFLRKGGRIGGASHLVGSLLSIKPVLEVRDGVVEVDSKQRTRTRAVQYLASKAVDAGPLERIALADGRASDAGEVADMLRKAKSEHPLEISTLGPVVGSHTGPGSLGVCFMLARS